jgi:PPK2 family polyphosphate:nucleotide phosphotransferase
MKPDAVIASARKLSRSFRVSRGSAFRLKDVDPDDTGDFRTADKPRAVASLAAGVAALTELQDRLYASDRWAVLLVFQAMDAAGKDGAIKHVMSGVNPQGCQVFSFKAPSNEELDHDYLWRCMRCLPERGRIGIFNRSYYEEVLIVRVHRELLLKERLPSTLVGKGVFQDRCEDICRFERYLTRNGIAICKFFLHVSKKEQRRRLLERLEKPEKQWKFSAVDVKEREYWDDYMDAYEEMIRATATRVAPWYVVPADHKWFTRLVVAEAVAESLASLDLQVPRLGRGRRKELAIARAALERERR